MEILITGDFRVKGLKGLDNVKQPLKTLKLDCKTITMIPVVVVSKKVWYITILLYAEGKTYVFYTSDVILV